MDTEESAADVFEVVEPLTRTAAPAYAPEPAAPNSHPPLPTPPAASAPATWSVRSSVSAARRSDQFLDRLRREAVATALRAAARALYDVRG